MQGTQEYGFHPVSAIFPLLEGEELAQLAENIKQNGLLEAITVSDGLILDGRNRYRACQLAGTKPRFEVFESGKGSAVTFVVSKNLHRRHLTISQRAAIALQVVPMLAEEAKKRQGARTDLVESKGRSTSVSPDTDVSHSATAVAADLMGISKPTVDRALRVQRESPDQIERIKAGEITVGEAHRAVAETKGKSNRQSTLEGAAHRRMEEIVGGLTGASAALEGLNFENCIAGCTRRDISSLAVQLAEICKRIRDFYRNLRRKAKQCRSQNNQRQR